MRILLVASAYNSMTRRVHVELADRGHEVSVELALSDEVLREGVRRCGGAAGIGSPQADFAGDNPVLRARCPAPLTGTSPPSAEESSRAPRRHHRLYRRARPRRRRCPHG